MSMLQHQTVKPVCYNPSVMRSDILMRDTEQREMRETERKTKRGGWNG